MSRRFIVEADGASRGNPGPAAYGALLRDADSGEVLAELAEYIGVATNNVAEYRGLIAALTAARDLDPTAEVQVRLDSKLVVEQMSGRWKVRHRDIAPLVGQAQALFPLAGQVTYRWVPRERNARADRLANEALDEQAAGQAGADDTPSPGRTRAPGDTGEEASEPTDPAGVSAPVAAGWSPAGGPPTTFLLLRHGETALSAERRFSGTRGDPELTADGLRQAEQAADALAGWEVVAVVSSPLRRAEHTADIVAKPFALPVRVDEGYRETDFGAWDGLTFAEVQREWPGELSAWLASAAVAPPDGESFAAVERRVRRARDRTIARYAGRTVLVVSHVTPIKTLVRLALSAPPAALYRMELAPGSLTVIDWYADGNAVLRAFNASPK